MSITSNQKETLALVLNYILNSEEAHYEGYLDVYGPDSEHCKNHIYSLARSLWVEFEMDFTHSPTA